MTAREKAEELVNEAISLQPNREVLHFQPQWAVKWVLENKKPPVDVLIELNKMLINPVPYTS